MRYIRYLTFALLTAAAQQNFDRVSVRAHGARD